MIEIETSITGLSQPVKAIAEDLLEAVDVLAGDKIPLGGQPHGGDEISRRGVVDIGCLHLAESSGCCDPDCLVDLAAIFAVEIFEDIPEAIPQVGAGRDACQRAQQEDDPEVDVLFGHLAALGDGLQDRVSQGASCSQVEWSCDGARRLDKMAERGALEALCGGDVAGLGSPRLQEAGHHRQLTDGEILFTHGCKAPAGSDSRSVVRAST